MAFLRILWSHRRVLVLSAVLAVVVAVPFGLLRPPSYKSSSQVVLPPSDPAARNLGKGDTSVVLARLQNYIDNNLGSAVDKKLGKRASSLTSVSAAKGANSAFFTVSASATQGATARAGVSAGVTILVAQYNRYSSDQVQRLQAEVNEQTAAIDAQEPPLQNQQQAKQTQVDSLRKQAGSLQASVSNARDAVAKAQITGKFVSTSASQNAVATLQPQLDAVNSQLTAAQTDLERLNTQIGVLDGRRKALNDEAEAATRSYLDSSVRATAAAPPSVPQSGTLVRLAEALALGIVVGLVVGGATIVWLERAKLRVLLRSGIDKLAVLEEPEQGAASPPPPVEPGQPPRPVAEPEPELPQVPSRQAEPGYIAPRPVRSFGEAEHQQGITGVYGPGIADPQ